MKLSSNVFDLALALALCVTAPAAASVGSAARLESTTEDQRALKRIFHLSGGGTVRAIGKLDGERWMVRHGSTWSPLGAEPSEVKLERTVLAQLRSMRSQLRGESAAAPRCTLADWALSQGLLLEGLDELAEAIAIAPDSACVQATLARHAKRFRLPSLPAAADGVEDFLAEASRLHPALRTRLARTWAETGPADERVLTRELQASASNRRAFAMDVARYVLSHPEREPEPTLVRALLRSGLYDPVETLRRDALLALKSAGDSSFAEPYARALSSSTARTRVRSAEALATLGYINAVPALVNRLATLAGSSTRVRHANLFVGRQIAYVQDFDVEVAQSQSIGDPSVNVLTSGQVLDVGVVGVSQVSVSVERQGLVRALESITGERYGARADRWANWWSERPQAASAR